MTIVRLEEKGRKEHIESIYTENANTYLHVAATRVGRKNQLNAYAGEDVIANETERDALYESMFNTF